MVGVVVGRVVGVAVGRVIGVVVGVVVRGVAVNTIRIVVKILVGGGEGVW